MSAGDFRDLADDDIRQLSAALRARYLEAPFPAVTLQRFVPAPVVEELARKLGELWEMGFRADHLAVLLDAIAAERAPRETVSEVVDLVSTGPEAPAAPNRDTAVVVRELFAGARESVIVVGYAVYQGRQVFQALAERMDASPELRVSMFLDVHRPQNDTSSDADILARFAARFRCQEWPGKRLPRIYYDPRSLEQDPAKRASLHAKCIVVDRERAFVSSANFTQAAQVRNVEVGVLIRSPPFAAKLSDHFEALADVGCLRPVPGMDER